MRFKHYTKPLLFALFLWNGFYAGDLKANIHSPSLDALQLQPLTEVLKELSEEYEILFSFETKLLSEVKVDFELVAGEDVDKAINRLLFQTGLRFKAIGSKYFVIHQDTRQGNKNARKIKRKLKQIHKLEQKGEVSLKKFQPKSMDKLSSIIHSVVKLKEEKNITGTVKDNEGEPLIGATIQEKGGSNGTITDLDGSFSLTVPEGVNTLVVTYTGYEDLEVIIGNQRVLDIVLNEGITLDNVIVVGYTSLNKKNVTGAISALGSKDIENLKVLGVEQALQGNVSGVQVSQQGGPGGGAAIRIRGYSTVGNNEPLYVIDGVPTQNRISQFNLNDVESIQVLKDAASTSIYGSRAANGVVIIETKKGRKSEGIKLDFNSYVGVQQATNLPTMLGPQQYGDLLFEAQQNAGIVAGNAVYGNGANAVVPDYIDEDNLIPSSSGTDWFDEMFGTAPIQYYNLGLSKGGENSTTYASFSILQQEGILKHTGFDRYTARFNNSFSLLNSRLKIGHNLSYSYTEGLFAQNNQVIGGSVFNGYLVPAIVPVYDINGNFAGPTNGLGDAVNPILTLALNKDNNQRSNNIFGNVFAELEVIEGLTLRTSFGLDVNQFNFKQYSQKFVAGITQRNVSELKQTTSNELSWTFTNSLKYIKSINQHKFQGILGMEAIKSQSDVFQAFRDNFLIDDIDFRYLDSGQGQQTNSGVGTEWALYSYFGALYYDFKDKYLFSASVRRDGSSRFSNSNRYGTFPAISAGWRLSQEDFLKDNPLISDLKLRCSWGQSGNQEIGNFASYTTFATNAFNTNFDITGSNTSTESGFALSQIGNPEVKWETTTQTNFGIDFGFFDYSLTGSIDFFVKNTKDVLVQLPTLATQGQANPPFVNAGEIENRGLEFQLKYNRTVNSDFSFSIGANGGFFRNEVKKLGEGIDFLSGSISNNSTRGLTLSRTFVGHPLAVMYGHVVDGIFQSQTEVDTHAEQVGAAVGRFKYADINNDGMIDNEDRKVIGNPHPDFSYGITLDANYKNFDLNVFMQGLQGVDLYNFAKYHTDFFYDPFNKHSRVLDAWSPSNTEATIPQLSAVNSNDELRPSTYFIEDGSYLRLKNFTIGYTFSDFFKNSSSTLRIYVQAQNLLTFTKYSGLDPEVSLESFDSPNRNLDIGIDRGVYPNAQSFMFGINFNF